MRQITGNSSLPKLPCRERMKSPSNSVIRGPFTRPQPKGYPLDLTIPMAERLRDLLASRNFSQSLYEILPGLFDAEFKNKNPEQVMLVYGEFLDGLRAWQENAMMQHNRFPFMFSWPHRLEEIIETSRAQRQRTKS